MIIVKKIDTENQIVTISSDGILQEIAFDNFLTIPEVSDVITLQNDSKGNSQYVVLTTLESENGQSSKSKMIAGLLGLFLGYLGIHNFYLGNTIKGLIQLLGFTLGWITLGLVPAIIAIWAFIESILILVSKKGSKWHQDAQGLELID